MPHLAPMNWPLALLLVWFFISLMNSMNWWITTVKFSFYNTLLKQKKETTWTW